MGDKLKSLGTLAFGGAILVGVLALPIIFFYGVVLT